MLANQDPVTVQLTPPILNEKTISQQIACTRPMREGRFNISHEQVGSKQVIHCYGHGGSGWTTLFGSVGKAIALFEQSHPDASQPIRIVGSGCMGLTAAIELSRMGYKVAGITTKDLYDCPSWLAAGYFALVSVKTSPEEQANLNEIGMHTFLTYQQIEKGQHPYITKEAVRYMPVYCSIETEAGVEDLETRGLIPSRQYVTLDFGNGVTHPGFVKYMTYFMNTTILMRQLTAEVRRLGISIEVKTIHSFDDIAEKVAFNCTGMGARELNQDNTMISVRGHLLVLNEAAGTGHMDYMIYTKVKQNGKEEYIYLFPKNVSVTQGNIDGTPCAGVIGGTFLPNIDQLSPEEQQKFNQEEFQRLMERNQIFFLGNSI
jgi:hypothetical protein